MDRITLPDFEQNPGAVLFMRYSIMCLPVDLTGEVTGDDALEYLAKIRQGIIPPVKLFQSLFPRAMGQLVPLLPNGIGGKWPIDIVRKFWRDHVGPKSQYGSCSTISAVVTGINYGIVHGRCLRDGIDLVFLDMLNLGPMIGQIVYTHKGVVCEVEEWSYEI